MTDPVRARRILVTNDDGIHAHGLRVLERIARRIGEEVWVVAPETDQSGAGHSLTLRRPLRIRRVSHRRFTVDGTPTDCVLLGLQHILDAPADLVLSGINAGANLGEDVTYSGTVAAAMEATLLGVRAVALSQACDDRSRVHWSTAETFAFPVLERLLAVPWEQGVFMNVNFPDRPVAAVRGLQITRQGRRKIGDHLVERIDPRGDPYIWIGALRGDDRHAEGTDLAAIAAGCVSITPVQLDMTHCGSLELLRRTFDSWQRMAAE